MVKICSRLQHLYQDLMEIVLIFPLSLMGRTKGSFQAQIEDILSRMGCIFPGTWKTAKWTTPIRFSQNINGYGLTFTARLTPDHIYFFSTDIFRIVPMGLQVERKDFFGYPLFSFQFFYLIMNPKEYILIGVENRNIRHRG